jgi:hypothetical protein
MTHLPEPTSTTAPPLTPRPTPSIEAPPPPTPPPDIVRLRVDLQGRAYRQLRHISIETSSSVNEMVGEAVEMMLRYYRAQGIPASGETGGGR